MKTKEAELAKGDAKMGCVVLDVHIVKSIADIGEVWVNQGLRKVARWAEYSEIRDSPTASLIIVERNHDGIRRQTFIIEEPQCSSLLP